MLNLILTVLVIIAGIALFFYFWRGRGFKGKTLRYAVAVIIFTAVALIGLINHEMIFAFLEEHLGTFFSGDEIKAALGGIPQNGFHAIISGHNDEALGQTIKNIESVNAFSGFFNMSEG